MSATNRGSERKGQDFYPTPEWVTDLILKEFEFPEGTTFCEPCKGEGHIYKKLPEGSSWAELSEGIDYCVVTPFPADVIITNPPFSRALTFLGKSLREGGTVIYLLRINFLGSQKRRAFWAANPLSHLFVLSQRPSFTGGGTDATEYAWFVWDRKGFCKRPPGIYVL